MSEGKNLKVRHFLKQAGLAIFALAIGSKIVFAQELSSQSHKKTKRHSIKMAKSPKHIVKVDLSDAPSESDVEPLSLGQKASEKLVRQQLTTSEKLAQKSLARKHSKILLAEDLNIGSSSAGSNFGTANEGRSPAGETSPFSLQKSNLNSLWTSSAKLNSRESRKMLQSIRKKTDQSIREEYD